MSNLQQLHRRYLDLVNSIPFVEKDLDYSILEKRTPHLEELDRIGNSAISVFDMFRKTHAYISPSYRERLGLPDDMNEGPQGFEQLMHPDDLLIAFEAGYYFLKMMMKIDEKHLGHFKLVNEFRIRKPDDGWMRMTEQHQILETDPRGNIWLSLSIADVSPDQNIHDPMKSRLVDQKTGEVFTLPWHNGRPIPFLELTNREKEILHRISEGHISKQIADELYISVHTVNTHRQNIIEKMNVTNTAEAIRLASRMGIL